jgi:hypothetical protein
MNPRTREFVFTRVLPAVVVLGALYEAYEHHLIPGVNQPAPGNAAASTPAWPAFLTGQQPQAGDVTFTALSSHDTAGGGLLVNDAADFRQAQRTAYIEPGAKGPWTAASIRGKTVTIKGVPLSTYHNNRLNKDVPEYRINSVAQLSVQ